MELAASQRRCKMFLAVKILRKVSYNEEGPLYFFSLQDEDRNIAAKFKSSPDGFSRFSKIFSMVLIDIYIYYDRNVGQTYYMKRT